MLQQKVKVGVGARHRHDEELATIFETAAQLAAELDVETVLQAIVERRSEEHTSELQSR